MFNESSVLKNFYDIFMWNKLRRDISFPIHAFDMNFLLFTDNFIIIHTFLTYT